MLGRNIFLSRLRLALELSQCAQQQNTLLDLTTENISTLKHWGSASSAQFLPSPQYSTSTVHPVGSCCKILLDRKQYAFENFQPTVNEVGILWSMATL